MPDRIALCRAHPGHPAHARFITTAHVVEEWVVSPTGDWIETLGSLETAHGPDPANTWTCATCGAAARFEPFPAAAGA